MKMLIIALALLTPAVGLVTQAYAGDRTLQELTRSGSLVHTSGIWGGK